MNNNSKFYGFKITLSGILCLFLYLDLYAQNTKQFSDAYGLQGEVKFSGEWVDTMLPKQGNYQLKWRNVSANELTAFLAKGRLKKFKPEGNFQWEEATWNYAIQPGTTLFPAFIATGNRYAWNANFSEGNATGLWKFSLDSINAAMQILQRKIQIQAQYNNGNIAGSIAINDYRKEQPFTLNGMCDASGFATGKWIFQFTDSITKEPVREERFYEQGLLTEVKTITKDTVVAVSFDMLKGQLQAIKNNTSGLNFRIGDEVFYDDGASSTGIKMLNNYVSDFLLAGFQLQVFPYGFKRNGVQFRKIEYPISAEEKRFISQTDSLIHFYSEEADKRLHYRNILINRGWSKELDVAIAYAQLARLKYDELDSLLKRVELPLFTYKNHHEQGVMHWIDLLNNNSIAFTAYHDSLTVPLPVIQPDEKNFELFKTLYEFSLAVALPLQNHLKIIDKSYTALQKEDELQLLEDVMTAELNALDSIYKPLTGMGAAIRQRWIEEYFKNELQLYTQTTNYEAAKLLANRLVEKMNELINRAEEWVQIDSMPSLLKEQYTHFAYNPYNGKHDIEIRIKKRFYNKVITVVYPWLKDKFISINDWETLLAHWNTSIDFRQDLIDFADIDNKSSKRTDSRFRKEKNNEKAIRILNNYLRNK